MLPLFASAAPAAAQGLQTGEISGTVSSSDGLTLPGATVTVRGPALQGVRTVTTDQNGNYVLRALPPGQYEITFEMSGLRTRTERAAVELGRQGTVNAVLEIAGAQSLFLNGFFRDQMRARHNVEWYDQLGTAFYERAMRYAEERERKALFGRLASHFTVWTAICNRLHRTLREQHLILRG